MTDIYAYGYTETTPPAAHLLPGRVTACFKNQYHVVCREGEVSAVLKGSFMHEAADSADYPAVGDFVWLDVNPGGPSRITELMPRKSMFSRADFSGHARGYAKTITEQVVAVNFDYVFIVTSLNQDFKMSRITRYLTQARQSGGQPVVILTKADLTDDAESPLATVKREAPGVPAHAISAHTGFNMEALSPYLAPGKTIVFLGMSGVGKSSLLNALMGAEVMAVKEIREGDSRGRHTTTHRQLLMLPGGAMVIDTPGMRELGLFGAEEGIAASFSEVEKLLTACRFSDCRHENEPGCAVRQALADGRLSQREWQNYQAQLKENKYVDDRAGFMQGKRAWQKTVALHSRHLQKHTRKGKRS